MAIVVIIAVTEAAIALGLLPWLPKTLHGMEVLMAVGIYMGVFFCSIACWDYWTRRRVINRRRSQQSQRGNWF